MGARSDDEGDLTAAAGALERELGRFHELASAIQHEKLSSEKNVRRAARALDDLRASGDRLGQHLTALVSAIEVARQRQQAEAEAVQLQAAEIARRAEALAGLSARWDEIRAESEELNRDLQRLAGGNDGDAGLRREGLSQGIDRLAGIVGKASAVRDLATAEDFPDLARQAESLRLQLLTAQNKLSLLREG